MNELRTYLVRRGFTVDQMMQMRLIDAIELLELDAALDRATWDDR